MILEKETEQVYPSPLSHSQFLNRNFLNKTDYRFLSYECLVHDEMYNLVVMHTMGLFASNST